MVENQRFLTGGSEIVNFNVSIGMMSQNGTMSDDPSDAEAGSASDYILIAMIIAMMLCMAVCCLCLFCRSSAHFTICGYNCDVNDRNASVALDDVSELHEVVPLTPATVNTYNLPDIESKLKSDPPPPQYNEVAGTTMLDRFKWRSKRKTNTNDTANDENAPNKSDEMSRNKSKRSDRRGRLSRTFHRSSSNQQTRAAQKTASLKVQQSKGHTKSSSLQHSASDCVISIPKTVLEEAPKSIQEATATIVAAKIENENVEANMKRLSQNSKESKDPGPDLYDDEVFM